MVSTINMNACKVITKIWNIAHKLPGIGMMYHGNNAISKNTNSPVNIFPKSLNAKLSGLANSSTKVNIKLTGAK